MTDALKKRQPEDKRVIRLSETWEVEYWTKTLDVSVAQLRTAVANVGKDTQKVKQYLGK
ncbi:MAG: DUF3606 domain-containing protein [Pantoea sp.]|uniref:DUF3606 domain-containing protein n=1 Tax=Pantoea sp. TaxID=69393 RepID=UPI00239C2B01|nr:DUF3606 domain-containing protein [Pantoea sp.]MDE1185000.1 DUF3606 domain-containing protein [Pantoea sp.]